MSAVVAIFSVLIFYSIARSFALYAGLDLEVRKGAASLFSDQGESDLEADSFIFSEIEPTKSEEKKIQRIEESPSSKPFRNSCIHSKAPSHQKPKRPVLESRKPQASTATKERGRRGYLGLLRKNPKSAFVLSEIIRPKF